MTSAPSQVGEIRPSYPASLTGQYSAPGLKHSRGAGPRADAQPAALHPHRRVSATDAHVRVGPADAHVRALTAVSATTGPKWEAPAMICASRIAAGGNGDPGRSYENKRLSYVVAARPGHEMLRRARGGCGADRPWLRQRKRSWS